MNRLQYLSGWREDNNCCYMSYKKLTNEEINKVIEDETFRICESK